MILPANHIMEYSGETFNWFVGDAISPDIIPANKSNPHIYWCFGIKRGWNTRNAKYCGRFDVRTREVTDIKPLK